MSLFKSPGMNSAENIMHSMHKSLMKKELPAASNSRKLGNSLTKAYADLTVDV